MAKGTKRMRVTKARELTVAERYLLLTAGILITATGTYFFKFPNNFSTGGVSGLSLILGRIIPSQFFTPSVFMLIINMLLLAVGFIFLGRSFAFSTVYCSMLLSLAMTTLEKICPLAAPLTSQPFLELCFAVLLPAFGSAVLFHLGASSGGTDIIAMILRKFTSMNIGTALMVSDAVIALCSVFVFGIKTCLFSVLGLMMKAFLIDSVIESINLCKFFTIVTTKPHEVCEYIIKTMNHSATVVDGEGAYTGQARKLVLVACRRTEAVLLRRAVRAMDEHAFMFISNTSEIIGKGFRSV